MRRGLIAFVFASIAAAAMAQNLTITPTTTYATETGNNTSTSSLWQTSSNGDLGPSNVSKVDTHTLMYPGFAGKIYAHLMGWFCQQAGSSAVGAGNKCGSHVQVGYNSNDPAEVHAQVEDMISRGIDGVIHDWYGPNKTSDDVETKNYMHEAEQHPGFTFALMVDKGAIEWFSCYPNCTATQALTQILQYAATTFFNSPAYMRINGRPVVTNFDIDLHYTVDWNYVAANTPGNPIFLFQNSSGFTHTLSSGSYSWVIVNSQFGLDYLDSFYKTGMQYPSEMTVGTMYKGFNDTLASWSGNRIMSQQCGQTWLQAFQKANSLYNSANPLGAIQLVTWDDYEEGTEIETGIDNCVSVNASVSGTVLNWSISGGNENTIDHYTVFISTDGQNLMSLGDFAAGVHSVDLSSFGAAAGTYTLYVKAVGVPSVQNHMSAAVQYTVAPPSPAQPPITTTEKALSLSAAPAAQTVSPGHAGTFTLTVTETGATDPVQLSCSGLPAGVSCSFSSSTVTAGASGTNVQLTIQANAQSAQNRHDAPVLAAMFGAVSLFGLAGVPGVIRRRKLAVLALLAIILISQIACGGGAAATTTASTTSKAPTVTTATTYAITVTAVSGTVEKSTVVSLTVN